MSTVLLARAWHVREESSFREACHVYRWRCDSIDLAHRRGRAGHAKGVIVGEGAPLSPSARLRLGGVRMLHRIDARLHVDAESYATRRDEYGRVAGGALGGRRRGAAPQRSRVPESARMRFAPCASCCAPPSTSPTRRPTTEGSHPVGSRF